MSQDSGIGVWSPHVYPVRRMAHYNIIIITTRFSHTFLYTCIHYIIFEIRDYTSIGAIWFKFMGMLDRS